MPRGRDRHSPLREDDLQAEYGSDDYEYTDYADDSISEISQAAPSEEAPLGWGLGGQYTDTEDERFDDDDMGYGEGGTGSWAALSPSHKQDEARIEPRKKKKKQKKRGIAGAFKGYVGGQAAWAVSQSFWNGFAPSMLLFFFDGNVCSLGLLRCSSLIVFGAASLRAFPPSTPPPLCGTVRTASLLTSLCRSLLLFVGLPAVWVFFNVVSVSGKLSFQLLIMIGLLLLDSVVASLATRFNMTNGGLDILAMEAGPRSVGWLNNKWRRRLHTIHIAATDLTMIFGPPILGLVVTSIPTGTFMPYRDIQPLPVIISVTSCAIPAFVAFCLYCSMESRRRSKRALPSIATRERADSIQGDITITAAQAQWVLLRKFKYRIMLHALSVAHQDALLFVAMPYVVSTYFASSIVSPGEFFRIPVALAIAKVGGLVGVLLGRLVLQTPVKNPDKSLSFSVGAPDKGGNRKGSPLLPALLALCSGLCSACLPIASIMPRALGMLVCAIMLLLMMLFSSASRFGLSLHTQAALDKLCADESMANATVLAHVAPIFPAGLGILASAVCCGVLGYVLHELDELGLWGWAGLGVLVGVLQLFSLGALPADRKSRKRRRRKRDLEPLVNAAQWEGS